MHEKITWFWLAEKGVQNVWHQWKKSYTSAKSVIQYKLHIEILDWLASEQ